MANDVKFEGKERRMAKIEKCLAEYGLSSLEEARDLCLSKGINVDAIVKGVQPIAFENASWAYTLGAAVAIKSGVKSASEAAEKIGIGLQAFCIPGSVAEQRNVGLGTAIWARVCFQKRQSALHFLQAMRVLPLLKAQSALRARQTKCAKSRSELS